MKRWAVALVVGAGATFLPWLTAKLGVWWPVNFFLFPGELFLMMVRASSLPTHRMATALTANLMLYAGGTYVTLTWRGRYQKQPRERTGSGFMDEILSQRQTPVFTGVSLLISVVLVCFMLLVCAYARRGNLGFGALAIPPLLGITALAGVLVNAVAGSLATARGEAYAGRIALGLSTACVLAPFAFLWLAR